MRLLGIRFGRHAVTCFPLVVMVLVAFLGCDRTQGGKGNAPADGIDTRPKVQGKEAETPGTQPVAQGKGTAPPAHGEKPGTKVALSDLVGNWELNGALPDSYGKDVKYTFELEIKSNGRYSYVQTVGPFPPAREKGNLLQKGGAFLLPGKDRQYTLRVERGALLATEVGAERGRPMSFRRK
jgi:hypothetical protein